MKFPRIPAPKPTRKMRDKRLRKSSKSSERAKLIRQIKGELQ